MSFNNTDPGRLFGGTWQPLNEGRVLIGANSTYTAGSTGGESTHKLTVNEMPSHNHGGTFSGSGSTSSSGSHRHISGLSADVNTFGVYGSASPGGGQARIHLSGSGNAGTYSPYTNDAGSHTHSFSVSGNINSNGGDTAFNLMQPYIACYMWRRIA